MASNPVDTLIVQSADIQVESVMSVCVYADDFARSASFYSDMLGLKRSGEMTDNSCFFQIADNPNGLYLEGGYTDAGLTESSACASFMLKVSSAKAMHEKLKSAGTRMIHEQPQHLGGDNYWFRFFDPSGNIIEIVSTTG